MICPLNEKIIISVILGLTIIVFSIPILGSIIASQIVEPREIEVVTEYGNGTTQTSAAIPGKATVNVAVVVGVQNTQFYFPFVIAGFGIWLPWGAIITGQLPEYHASSIPVLLFWISSMISVPLMVRFTNQIALWRRIPYIYLIAALIGGLGIFLWTGFGN